MKKYFKDMNIARGIGIFLVILGHSFPDALFNDNKFYEYVYNFIYSFHMPFFFFISGFFALSIINISNVKNYIKFIYEKFQRLMIPYLCVSMIAIPIKLLLNKYAARPIKLSTFLVNLAFFPLDIPIQYFWFIYVLFIIFLLSPVLIKIPKEYLIMISVILNLIPSQYLKVFYLGGVLHYFLFFYFGFLFRQYYEHYDSLSNKLVISSLLMIVLVILNYYNINNKMLYPFYSLLKSIIGIAAFICLSTFLQGKHKIACLLDELGKYSYDIFLFSWFFQVAARIVFYQVLKINYDYSIIIMIICGFCPIILSKYILRKIHVFDKLFLGNFKKYKTLKL